MTLFVVQARGSDDDALVRAHFIKDGFAWGGFFLGWLWLAYHRLWLPALIYVAIEIAFFFAVSPHVTHQVALVCNVLLRLFVGFEGNRWRERKGARRAVVTEIIEADDRAAAEVVFFTRRAAGQAVA